MWEAADDSAASQRRRLSASAEEEPGMHGTEDMHRLEVQSLAETPQSSWPSSGFFFLRGELPSDPGVSQCRPDLPLPLCPSIGTLEPALH